MRRAAGNTLRPGGLFLTDRLAQLAEVAAGWKVLDVGSGSGDSVRRLRQRYGAAAFGVDASFDQVRSGSGLPLAVADAALLPVRPGSLDMVLCECVLSLLPDPSGVLDSFRSLLVPGGILALTDLYLRGPGRAHPHAGSCLAWNAVKDDVCLLVEQAGFSVCLFEDHSRLLGELAARLVLAGEPSCSLLSFSACGAGGASPGYFLLLARRREHAA